MLVSEAGLSPWSLFARLTTSQQQTRPYLLASEFMSLRGQKKLLIIYGCCRHHPRSFWRAADSRTRCCVVCVCSVPNERACRDYILHGYHTLSRLLCYTIYTSLPVICRTPAILASSLHMQPAMEQASSAAQMACECVPCPCSFHIAGCPSNVAIQQCFEKLLESFVSVWTEVLNVGLPGLGPLSEPSRELPCRPCGTSNLMRH